MSSPHAKLPPNSDGTRMSGGEVLPDELMEEVLSHLPVKSLVQLRCVCKSWKTLISDPIFVKMHLQQSQRNRNLALIVCEKFYYDKDASVVPFPVNTLLKNQSITIPYVPYYRLKYKRCFRVIGSCNGLLCLLDSHTTKCGLSKNACFRLWNPSTRKISKKLGCISNPGQRYLHLSKLRFAFGYDKSTDTYKAVAFSCNEVRIFSFRDNVWKNIQCFPLVPFYREITTLTLYTRQRVNEGVYLNGTINWLAIQNYKYMWDFHDIAYINVEQCVIISLDLGLETYCQLRLPCGFVDGPPTLPIIAALKNCLCFCYHIQKSHFVIWMMMEFGVEESWTQFLKINYHNLQVGDLHGYVHEYVLYPLCLSESGDTLILASNREERAFLYNLRDNRVERTRITNRILWMFSHDYVESLVSTC